MGVVYPTVGAIHESPVDFDVILRNGQDRSVHAQNTIYRVGRGLAPAVSAPSERGLSNAQHLTGGEIFPFLSLRLLPAAKATSLPEGGITSRRGRRPLRSHCSLPVP